MCNIAGWVDFDKDLTENSKTIDDMIQSISNKDCSSEVYMQHETMLLQGKAATQNDDRIISKQAKGDIYTIVFNGRLYNINEMKNELVCLGYNVAGETDAEVMLNSYIEWGKESLNKINGFFAFAIWKEKEKSIFLARDRVGAYPLFFYTYNNGLLFASSIKTLLKNPLVKPLIDNDGLKQLFLLGPGKCSGSGIIKGISELKPGYCLYFDKTNNTPKQYWRLKATEYKDNIKQSIDYVRYLICDSVNLQLRGKSDVACMLSGGLDSSVLSYLTAKEYRAKGKTLTTYSVDYADNTKYFEKNKFQPDSDNKYIPIMSKFIGSNHINIVLDNQKVAESVTEATISRGLPGMADIDSSLLLFLKEIKKSDNICFTGECADEFFGGYPWYHDEKLLYSATFPWSRSIEMREKLVQKGVLKDDCKEYVNSLYNQTINETDYLESDSSIDRRTREMFMLNFYWFMQTLIDRNDRMAAAAGVETRVPFCDYRIIEYAYNMPRSIKAYKRREKGILREAFKDILPPEIVWRKKSPYPKSCNPIIYSYAKQKLKDIMEDKTNLLPQLINKCYLKELMEMPPMQADPWYGQLMRLPQIFGYLISLDVFFKEYNITVE